MMQQATEQLKAVEPEQKTELTIDYEQLLDATIMIVDDEAITMEMVQVFLEGEGYHNFVMIEDSTQAIQAIEEKRPDVLLLDLIMPTVSGFDILHAIRVHPKLNHMPIIILTASTDAESKLSALDLGATDFLAKPVDPSELILRVRNTLAAKAYLDQLAYYDPLTSLPNRQMFMERLEWTLKWAGRDQKQLSLMSIQLDQFDKVSDTIGLLAGDELLCEVAQRIEAVVRNIDALGHFKAEEINKINLFRFDRGVFSLLVYGLHTEDNAALVAERILQSIRAPLKVGDMDIFLTASIGISAYPAENENAVELLRLASTARDYAANRGGDAFQFSSKEINLQYKMRLSLESRLRKALERDELLLHYQPKVDTETEAIKSVEALVRWQTNDGRVISPGEFIPVAEETGLIVPIGEWVLIEACNQLAEWNKAGIETIGMAVNLSPVQFETRELPGLVNRVVKKSGINPKFLTLELTESMLLEDIDKKIKMMERLKDIGIKLSIDDFGTGYSSLNYLKMLPVDELKIDRSFLKDLATDKKSRALVSSIIYLSRNLGLSNVAEGVETVEQWKFLQQENCDLCQGFLFSRPLPSGELFESHLSDWKNKKSKAAYSPSKVSHRLVNWLMG